MLVARGFILHNKKNFVRDPLAPSLALCRPSPTPLRPRSIFARDLHAAAHGRPPHAGASMATQPACIRSFGSRFSCCKLAPVRPCGRHALGHLGHTKNNDPNDLKGADLAPRGIPGFGSFGSFCHRIKIGGRRRVMPALQSFYGLTLI